MFSVHKHCNNINIKNYNQNDSVFVALVFWTQLATSEIIEIKQLRFALRLEVVGFSFEL